MLLSNLGRARCTASGEGMELALASRTKRNTYELKTRKPETKALLDCFMLERRIWVMMRGYRLLEGNPRRIFMNSR
jgi:hypothetical protein